jgi:hypothetical protein
LKWILAGKLYTTMDTKYKIGDKVTYQDVDMEYYSRGYGLSYERKTATVVSIVYKLSNGETVEESKLTKIEDTMPKKETSTKD